MPPRAIVIVYRRSIAIALPPCVAAVPASHRDVAPLCHRPAALVLQPRPSLMPLFRRRPLPPCHAGKLSGVLSGPRLLQALPPGRVFLPLFTLYLYKYNDNNNLTSPFTMEILPLEEIKQNF